jgi:rhodanese-related sulfurtransferase
MNFFSNAFHHTESDKMLSKEKIPDEFKSLVRSLIPLNELTDEGFAKALNIARFKRIPGQQSLFNLGDNDKKTIYLVEGSVDLVSEDKKKKQITVNQVSAFYPLSNLKPRRYTATSLGSIVIVEFSSEELERVVHWDHVAMMESMSNIEVHDASEEDSDLSWIFHMTSSPSIAQFPASNIASLFKAFKQLEVSAGQKIINQGEKGDCYYVIAKGTCEVLVKQPDGHFERVNILGEGDTFGEEALLSNLPRNATVSMVTDGMLMALSKNDFNHLLKERILTWVKPSDANSDKYIYLDVRTESEFRNDGLLGSINLPLQDLRLKNQTLDKDKKYLVYCDNGSRSSSAAYLLAERGFDVSVMKGGLSGFSKEDDKRLSKPPIPDNLEQYLTEQQILAIRKLEGFGGSLWFVRRALFADITPVVRLSDKLQSEIAVVEADGSLNKNHGLNIRDD